MPLFLSACSETLTFSNLSFNSLRIAIYLTDVVSLEVVRCRLLDHFLADDFVVAEVLGLSLLQNDEVDVGSGAQIIEDTRFDCLDGQLLGVLQSQVVSESALEFAVGTDRPRAHGDERRVGHTV